MRRCATLTRWEGNDIRTGGGDNARHCITGKRTIDGMCLDRVVAPRFQSHRAKGLQTKSSPPAGACFHVDDGPVRLNCFCN